MARKNVFVLGLDAFNHEILEQLPDAEEYLFHPLLSYAEIRERQDFPVEHLLGLCERRLDEFDGSIDAIVGWWDFPVTIMVPILCQRHGLPGPSVSSVLKCEHKFWSRQLQRESIPDHIPMFEAFDPFDSRPMAGLELLFPFWIKPIKSFRSFLAFRINGEDSFNESIAEMRRHVRRLSEPFNKLLGYAEDIPAELIEESERSCIAESLLSGSQCTLEGYAFEGEVHAYGIVDSVRDSDRSSLSRYEYPSALPEAVQDKMTEIAKAVMTHIGFEHGPFNIEFFYNQSNDWISLLEINPRQSQSHAYLFDRVHGVSNHKVMLDLALGRRPELPARQDPDKRAAKFMLRTSQDGFVTAVPGPHDMKRLARQYPDAMLEVLISEGMRLSQLMNQDSYSFEVADLYLSAHSQDELMEKYRTSLSMLPFRVAQERDLALDILE